MVSALDGKGIADLRTYLAGIVPAGPWHYSEDDVTDVPMRTQAAELTRECIYRFLHQELPYTTTVETTDWKAFKDGSARVEQTIYVERDSQKKIVLGKGGATIKKNFNGSPPLDRRDGGSPRASVPVRESARELGKRPGAIPGNGIAFPEDLRRMALVEACNGRMKASFFR